MIIKVIFMGWKNVIKYDSEESLREADRIKETNDYIKSWDMSYAQGNVIKYVTRYNLKHKDKNLQRQDLEKAEWYLKDLIQELKN